MALAQGAATPVPTNGAALTAAELREIMEYEKIVQFRDAVVAGTHPRIRVPPHLVGKQVNNSTRNLSSPNLPTPYRATASKLSNRSISGTYNGMSSPFYSNRSPSDQRAAASSHATIASKSEINPILLEKSDDLIKAEIQLQRTRLERALRDQIEQQRLSAKHQTSEAFPNFDVAGVLSKALALVHHSSNADAEPSVGARSTASDSFDEKTFYSSQHDTPAPSSSSQGQEEPLEVQAGGADERPAQIYSTTTSRHIADRVVVMTGASLSTNNQLPGQSHSHTQLSPLQHGPQGAVGHYGQAREIEKSDSSNSLGEVGERLKLSTQEKQPVPVSILLVEHLSKLNNMGSWLDFGEYDVDHSSQTALGELLPHTFEEENESHLIRGHDLSPYAPQPARVSSLATARNPPAPQADGALATVSLLRKSGISSTDSSPKGVKPSKKKDKKKLKVSSKIIHTPDSPYIKPEPRSPSPFAVATLPRPQKRPRQTGPYGGELEYDEPRYEDELQERVVERVPVRYKEPQSYERYEDRYEVEPRRPEPAYHPIDRENMEYRRISDGRFTRRPQSPAVYAIPYAPSEVRPVRAASHAIVERRPREESLYYREPLPRASVRPDADRERSRSPIMRERRSPIPMRPPRKPIRIVVDTHGREYIDPAPPLSMQQSVAPPSRYRDAEVIYERAPARTASGRAPVEYEGDRVIYRRPASPPVVPRRLATQPEYAVPENRAYRQREYSVRPMTPPGEEYVQLRGAPARRQVSQFDEAPREYIPRVASVRPAAAEAIRYEIPRDFRVQSVRPGAAPGEVAAQSQREYSVRPMETAPRREQVGGREAERYYEEMPTRRPVAEVAFIELPRAREQSVIVYDNDVRREVRDAYR